MAEAHAPDVAVIGGGIIGCSLAAFLSEAGLSVSVFEHDRVAAGASGRNQGIVQAPFDPVLAPLFEATVREYRALSALDLGFRLPEHPDGLLLVGRDYDLVAAEAAVLSRSSPGLRPSFIGPDELHILEPAIAPDVSACRIETAFAVPPTAATEAFAALARRRGVRFVVGAPAWRPWLERGGLAGVERAGERVPAEQVVVAAGAWSAGAIAAAGVDAAGIPIAPLWGVIATVRLARAPRHALEEIGVDAFVGNSRRAPADVPSIFSMVTSDALSGVGATGLIERPVEAAVAPILVERGAAFVPELRGAAILATRACPRPVCADGHPMLGPLPGVDGLFLAAGHGPWGISTGPGSARLVADLILGRTAALPEALSAGRFSGPMNEPSRGTGDDASDGSR